MNCLEGGNRFQGADIEPVQVIMKIFCIWLFLFINNEIIRKSRCCIILFTSHFWNILCLVFKRADYFVLGFMYSLFSVLSLTIKRNTFVSWKICVNILSPWVFPCIRYCDRIGLNIILSFHTLKWNLFEVLFQSDQWLRTSVKLWLLWFAFDKQTFDKWEWLFKVHYARVYN